MPGPRDRAATPLLIGSLVVVALAVLARPALAQPGGVAGRVFDRATGVGIEGVLVEITGPSVNAVLTGPGGLFDTTDVLQPGAYRARTRNTLGFVDESHAGDVCLPNCYQTGPSFSVVAGETTPLDIGLDLGGTVSGQVTDRRDAPLPGTRVEVRGGSLALYVIADAAGGYSFPALPAGSYVVGTDLRVGGFVNEFYDDVPCLGNCNQVPPTASPVEVEPGEAITGIDFALDLGAVITGAVRDAASLVPIVDTLVRAYDADGDLVGSVRADWQGAYRIGGLPAGVYFLLADDFSHVPSVYDGFYCEPYPSEPSCDVSVGTPVVLGPEEVRAGVDFALEPGGLLTGRITDLTTGVGVEGVAVRLVEMANVYGLSDAAGFWVISGVEPGTYTLRATSPERVDRLYPDIECELGCDHGLATPIAVGASDVIDGLDMALGVGGSLAGAVTGPGGQPLPDAWVHLWDGGPDWLDRTLTDAVGLYHFDALPDGGYYVTTQTEYPDEVFDDVSCEGPCDVTSGQVLLLAEGDVVEGVDFALPEAAAHVGGWVRSEETGASIHGATVRFFDEAGDEVAAATSGSSEHFGEHDWSYRADLLAAGEFTVRAAPTEHSVSFVPELWQDVSCPDPCDVTSGHGLVVDPDEVLELELVVHVLSIFSDDFELGRLDYWSSVVEERAGEGGP